MFDIEHEPIKLMYIYIFCSLLLIIIIYKYGKHFFNIILIKYNLNLIEMIVIFQLGELLCMDH